MTRRKYELPDFLVAVCSREHYVRWLQRKATAHVRRDRHWGNPEARQAVYKVAIHEATLNSRVRALWRSLIGHSEDDNESKLQYS
jgi:hypothetical protein